MRRWPLGLSLAFLLTLCVPSAAQFTSNGAKNSLDVRVKHAFGAELRVLAKIILYQGDIPADENYADGQGMIKFRNLEDGTYMVVVSAPGFESDSREIVLIGGRSAQVQLLLHPRPPDVEFIPPENDQVVSAKWLAAPESVRNTVLRARELRRQRDVESAMKAAQNALAAIPDFPFALHELGLCEYQLGKLDDAAKLFQRAIDVDPQFLPAYLNLAEIKSAAKDYDGAGKVLALAAKHHPTRGEPFLVMGKIQYDTGHLDKAEKAAQMALQRDTSAIPDVHVLLANVYLNKQEYDKALAEMDIYLDMAPKGIHVAAVKEKRKEILKKQKKGN